MSTNGSASVERRTFCRICPVNCGLVAEVAGDRIVRIRGDRSNVLTAGYLCPKGHAAGAAHHSPKRLDHPLIREAGGLRATDWSATLSDLAARLAAIKASSGADAIGVYFGTAAFFDTGAQVARAFAAQLGTKSWYTATSVDAPGWLLVAERMSGNPWLLPRPDKDADLVVLVGANPMVSHGHNFFVAAPKAQLKSWASRAGLWVVDPRRTETAAVATEHLRPLPGSDHLLFGFLIRSLLEEGGADQAFLRDHCANVAELARAVAGFSIERAARGMQIPAEQILRLLAEIRRVGRIAVHPGTGVSMSRNANVTSWLIWALHGVTGSLDRPRGIWFNRGMMRDWNATGWQPVNTSGPGPRSRPDLPSRCGEMPSGALADEIEAGNIRALLVIGGNPIIALPETRRLSAALERLDVLAVMDVVPTGTTQLASHVLPCAGQFERGDFSLAEIGYPLEFTQYTPAIVPLGAQRKPVWWIVDQIARRLGLAALAPDEITADTETAMLKSVVQAPRFDVDALCAGEARGILMPERTFDWVTRHLPQGRWNLAPADLVEQLAAATVVEALPGDLQLLPARQRHKLNSTMNDGTADPLGHDRPGLFIHPQDAAEIGLIDGQMARVTSASGTLTVATRFDSRMRRGCVSIPHGFESANVGFLTTSRRNADPLSGMVEQSGLQVRIAPCAVERAPG